MIIMILVLLVSCILLCRVNSANDGIFPSSWIPVGSSDDNVTPPTPLPERVWTTPGVTDEWRERRILQGQEATYGDHPYLCSLQYQYLGTWFHVCGSAIYNADTIITAAHCMNYFNILPTRVVCGEHSLQREDMFEQSRLVGSAFPHPLFRPTLSSDVYGPNDIALLKLTSPLTFNDYVMPLPLDTGTTPLTDNCVLAGWGRTEANLRADIVRRVNVTRLTTEQCENALSLLGVRILDSQVCFRTFGDPRSGCGGDSGSPIVCGNRVQGLFSWGSASCYSLRTPFAFTRVSSFLPWITRVLTL